MSPLLQGFRLPLSLSRLERNAPLPPPRSRPVQSSRRLRLRVTPKRESRCHCAGFLFVRALGSRRRAVNDYSLHSARRGIGNQFEWCFRRANCGRKYIERMESVYVCVNDGETRFFLRRRRIGKCDFRIIHTSVRSCAFVRV